MQLKKWFITLGCLLPLHMQGQNFLVKDASARIGSYVSLFNSEDNELYKQDIPNSDAAVSCKRTYRSSNARIRNWRRPTTSVGGLTESTSRKLQPDLSSLNSYPTFHGPESTIPSVVPLPTISMKADG